MSLFNKRTVADLEWVLLFKKYKLLYVETPKAACTKIRTLLILLNRGYEDPELAEFLQTTKPVPYYHWEFGIVDNYNLSKLELFDVFNSDYFKFTFVRNPYDKLVSAYSNKILKPHLLGNGYYTRMAKQIKAEISWHQLQKSNYNLGIDIYKSIEHILPKKKKHNSIKKPKENSTSKTKTTEDYDYKKIAMNIEKVYGKEPPSKPMDKFFDKIKAWLLDYPDLDGIDLNETPVSFEEFIEFICSQNVENMDEHWQPQTYYMGYEFTNYNFVGRVENFDRDIQYVLEKIDAPEYLYGHIEGKMNVSPKPKNNLWTDELANRVYEKYKSDFETFAYERDSYKR
ncbi:MAG: sulfotransferase family 2 domain-containing protein [Microcoleaceae cyanobacterium]